MTHALAVLVLLVGSEANSIPGGTDLPMDAPMSKGEFDAISQAAGSDRLKGMEPTGRTVAPDGKSGMIHFSNPNAENERWDPRYMVSGSAMRRMIEDEALMLVYFFSSDEDKMRQSYDTGKEFEKAAQELLEGDDQIACYMVDVEKDKGLESDFNVLAPGFKLFRDGKATDYAGPTSGAGIIQYMKAQAGPAVTKVKTAAELDAIVDSMQAAIVVGVFAGGRGWIAREHFTKNAEWLRQSFMYIEATVQVANDAAIFRKDQPFEGLQDGYAVVRPPRWVTKGEPVYSFTTDFKTMHKFVPANVFPKINPLNNQLIEHATKHKKMIALLMVNLRNHASKFRYVLKKFNRLLEADPTLASSFVFAIGDRDPMHPFLAHRLEHSTFQGRFAGDFEQEIKDFMMVVAAPAEKTPNYVSAAQVNQTAESLDAAAYAPFLQRIASGEEVPLIQGDDAPAAAGLRTMSMGFGPDGASQMEDVTPGAKKAKKPRKASKTKTKAKAKDEI